MEFPRLVYKSASNYELVEDIKEYDAKLKEGWNASVSDAIDALTVKVPSTPTTTIPAAPQVPDDNSKPTRAELETKAKQLGIKFDGRTKDAKLLALISEKV